MCVCCTHLFLFFPLAFVLVNDLFSGFSLFLFWKCVRFCFCFCCCLFLFVVCACNLCLLPCLTRCSFIDVLSCTPTGASEINYSTDLSRRRERESVGGRDSGRETETEREAEGKERERVDQRERERGRERKTGGEREGRDKEKELSLIHI